MFEDFSWAESSLGWHEDSYYVLGSFSKDTRKASLSLINNRGQKQTLWKVWGKHVYNFIRNILLLRATRGARNPNLQVVITHASHVCSHHSFEFPLKMNGMHRTQFDHARLDLLSLVIWSRVFWQSVTWNSRKAQRRSKKVLLRSLSPALGNHWLLLVCYLTLQFRMIE